MTFLGTLLYGLGVDSMIVDAVVWVLICGLLLGYGIGWFVLVLNVLFCFGWETLVSLLGFSNLRDCGLALNGFFVGLARLLGLGIGTVWVGFRGFRCVFFVFRVVCYSLCLEICNV